MITNCVDCIVVKCEWCTVHPDVGIKDHWPAKHVMRAAYCHFKPSEPGPTSLFTQCVRTVLLGTVYLKHCGQCNEQCLILLFQFNFTVSYVILNYACDTNDSSDRNRTTSWAVWTCGIIVFMYSYIPTRSERCVILIRRLSVWVLLNVCSPWCTIVATTDDGTFLFISLTPPISPLI